MEFESKIETYLRTGSWTGDQRYNPIVVEKGVIYARHNSIRIGNVMDAIGGVSVQFLWNGMIVGWTRLDSARLQGQDVRFHTVEVPEGRHEVKAR